MKRETIVRYAKAHDHVIVWTDSELEHTWVYRPGNDSLESVEMRDPVPVATKQIAEAEGCSGVWVRGVAGMAALFPIFAELPRYWCRECKEFHDSDETAEWMLLANVDRSITDAQFRALPFRLTHPKRSNAASA